MTSSILSVAAPMRWSGLAACGAATLLTFSLNCGGSVQVADDDGEGGNGANNTGASNTGASAAAGGTGNTGAGGTGNAGAGGTGNAGANGGSGNAGGSSPGVCGDFCATATACFDFPDCLAVCDDFASDPQCGGAWLDLAACIAANVTPPACFEEPCEKEAEVYSICNDEPGDCEDGSCGVGSDGSCSCDAECFGSTYETSCAPGPSGQLSCSCFQDGSLLGTCTAPANGFLACDVTDGCCASIFFLDG